MQHATIYIIFGDTRCQWSTAFLEHSSCSYTQAATYVLTIILMSIQLYKDAGYIHTE